MVEGHQGLSRRRLLKAGGVATLATSTSPTLLLSRRARAQQKTLRILQWKHFVPAYDRWFNDVYIKEWGGRNETEVVVDSVGLADLPGRVAAEAAAGSGHDLVLLLAPPAAYEQHVIDHREIYEECERRYGPATLPARKTTYNPATAKYFAFPTAYIPSLVSYRKSLWEAAGVAPGSWGDVLAGGRRIKLLHDKPVGISLAAETNSGWTLRAIMYSFGSFEQDAEGRPALNSAATLEAIRYVKKLYNEAMTADVVGWDATSNNRFMLNDEGCLTLDTISIPRASESMQVPFAADLTLTKVPEGPIARLGPSFGFLTYVIWKFAANIEGAKRFLVDYVASSRQALLASGFQNMPAWPQAVPDLAKVVAGDAGGGDSGKYALLADVGKWTTNIGHPGYTSAAIAEAFQQGLISTMFARAATGELTPEAALEEGDGRLRQIFEKWSVAQKHVR